MRMRIASNTWASLTTALSARRDVESAGLLFVETVHSAHGDALVVREAFAVPEAAYAIRRRDQLRLDPIALNRLIRPARDRGLGVFTIHTHPGATSADFSAADDRGDARLLTAFAVQMPDAVHGSIVITDDGADWSVRYLALGGLTAVTLAIVGKRVISSSVGRHAAHEDAFARQELALGEAGQAVLRRTTIGVIGAGGTGSVVSAQLAHLGIGKLLTMDGDLVERSNVSRLLGSRLVDVGMPKVEVVARYVRALGLGTAVVPVAEHLTASNAAQLRSCDLILACVDRHTPRAILNRLAYESLIPLIDVGTAFRVDQDGTLLGDAGRMIVAGPDRPCLACWGAIDPQRLRIESLPASNHEDEIAAGYIQGVEIAAPSVMPFNVMVSAAACIEVLRLLAGFAASETGPDRVSFSFSAGTVRRNVLAAGAACSVCGRLVRSTIDDAAE